MTAAWVNGYVGLPYREGGRDRAGLDCWGLVLLCFREQRALVLPDWRPGTGSLIAVVRPAIRFGLAERIDGPEPWAIVLCRRPHASHHAGICVGSTYVLHASASGVVCPRDFQFHQLYGDRSYWRWRP